MITSTNNLNGYYTVSGDIIESKMYAILKASEKKTTATWCYYDSIYESAIQNFDLVKISAPLTETYKKRAQQLRDQYDYLILNYSGGSDSHNILMTFLKNNIKLDHIYVQWPMSLMDKGLYTPNSADKSNSNFHSEWDLVLKKDLEWVSTHYPEITIEIADWTTNVIEKFYNDDLFTKSVTNLPSIARSQKQNTYSKTETVLSSKGKTVASIYGVDKPNIIKHQGLWYMYFVDTACMAQPNPDNPHGTEYFYFTPHMPDVAIHQAYKLAMWYNSNPKEQGVVTSLQDLAKTDTRVRTWTNEDHYKRYHVASEIVKLVCYPHWDFARFQADKPFSQLDNLPMGMRAWDNILLSLPNFERVQQAWTYHWKSYSSVIDQSNLRNKDTFSVFRSKYHPLTLPVIES
jgi:hypothetical protein